MLLLDIVHPFPFKLFSIDHVSDRAQMILLFVIMAVALLTNQAVFDNIYLLKIEARCMLAFFLRF